MLIYFVCSLFRYQHLFLSYQATRKHIISITLTEKILHVPCYETLHTFTNSSKLCATPRQSSVSPIEPLEIDPLLATLTKQTYKTRGNDPTQLTTEVVTPLQTIPITSHAIYNFDSTVKKYITLSAIAGLHTLSAKRKSAKTETKHQGFIRKHLLLW